MSENTYIILKAGWIVYGLLVFIGIIVMAYHPKARDKHRRHAAMALDNAPRPVEARYGQE